jgi:uncharacterized coiled-coil protein SlyX
METLLKILQEKMLLIEQLESQLIAKDEKIAEQGKTIVYWYEKFNELESKLQKKVIVNFTDK